MQDQDNPRGVKALLVRNDKFLILYKPNGNPDFPGGRVEGQETPEEALRREITEELGSLNIRILTPVAEWCFSKRPDLLIKGSTWLCSYEGGQISLGKEHSSFVWVQWNELRGTDIYWRYGLDKFMTNFKTLSQERRITHDRTLR